MKILTLLVWIAVVFWIDEAMGNIDHIFLDIGDNLGHRVASRIRAHLEKVFLPDKILGSMLLFEEKSCLPQRSVDSCLIISLGSTSLASNISLFGDISLLPSEGFRTVITTTHEFSARCKYALITNGKPLSDHHHRNISFDRNSVHYGAVVGAYASLERLGYAFLHPLRNYFPERLSLKDCNQSHGSECYFVHEESPYWPERGFHIHTQHPLELTDVLQGHDIPRLGPHGSHCRLYRKGGYSLSSMYSFVNDSSSYCERWEDMVDDVNRLFEWAVANRLNKLEWLLLGHYEWDHDLDIRMKRLKLLTNLGHDYSLLIGADCPVGNQQQHAWYMVNTRLPLEEQYKQIRNRVDWIFEAGFDFLTTESGLSEFTHPECEVMLGLINEFANYINNTWGREAAIKVHCSTGQVCEQYFHPLTGDPLNFNFLTMFASSSLAVFPHTVQVYSMDDPTSGAYGNNNFSYIEDYLVFEGKQGNRSVMFYGETAYWVNVDIDVPLFLPLYGQRRLYDLRKIAWREQNEGFRIDGQMNFDSGWEWGYWLNDVITARASWDPMISSNVSDSNYRVSDDQWSTFESSLTPFLHIFDDEVATRLGNLLVELTQLEYELLLMGRVGGSESPNLKKLSGFAYLSGSDTWIDLPRMFKLSLTQPDKIHLQETNDPEWKYILPLLREMETAFGKKADEFGALLPLVTYPEARLLLEEIADAVSMLALRSQQVRMLYESRDHHLTLNDQMKASMLKQSRQVIQAAATIVLRREKEYRVSWQRIAAWRENPTVYRFGYLWAVHSLYYWWRDQGIAEGGSFQSEFSPCYLNRMDASEVAVGWGKYALEVLRFLINSYSPFSFGYPLELVNCLSPPPKEYVFPRDLYHIHV